jgi:hypothetical protein
MKLPLKGATNFASSRPDHDGGIGFQTGQAQPHAGTLGKPKVGIYSESVHREIHHHDARYGTLRGAHIGRKRYVRARHGAMIGDLARSIPARFNLAFEKDQRVLPVPIAETIPERR